MLTFREMTPDDHDLVLPMAEAFYATDAVEHPVPRSVMERTFADAAGPAETGLRGVLMLEDGAPAGYLYLTTCYSCEVGGTCVILEELFLWDRYQGKGYGKQAMDWIMEQYPQCRRLRLEVTQVNQRAVHLYEKCGFTYLRYDQMVLDRP